MKTSILISSFAALCLMLTFTEAPQRRNSNNSNAISFSNFVFAQPSYAVSSSEAKSSFKKIESPVVSESNIPAKDLSYLKFNVDAHKQALSEQDDISTYIAGVFTKKSLDYLKFDVNNFINENEAPLEIATTDLDYLKFDVNAFVSQDEATEELPTTNFDYMKFDVNKFYTLDYLKFDVNNFINQDETSIELVVNDLEYVKFDVNNFITNDEAIETIDISENDLSYLKFDVNKFISSSEQTVELPVVE